MSAAAARAVRGRVLSFVDDPALVDGPVSYRLIADGMVLTEQGVIRAVGDARAISALVEPGTPVDHFPDSLIVPGLIDTHIHYPQTRVIASYGAQLLEWLQRYTFVEELKFADPDHAAPVARFFLDELFRNGTTTAVVYGTVHASAADIFLTESAKRNARMIMGKSIMDRNAPAGLLDTPQRAYDETKALAERWHGVGRQLYATTLRFAVTSTEAQMEMVGALVREMPDLYFQTHLSENLKEIAFIRELFPWSKSYTDVYDHYGMLGPRSLFGHCIHLADAEVARLAATGSIACFCPTSNLFIGSGLLDMARLRKAGVRVGLATDVGGGTSYSMLRTAAEAYKVLQLQGQNLRAMDAFYMMTLGNARILGLDDKIGRLEPGHEADITVLDARVTPAMAHRMESIRDDLEEELFVLVTMGDDRAVRATYVAGQRVV